MSEGAAIRLAREDDAEIIAEFNVNMAKESENIDLDPKILLRGVKAVFEVPQRGRYFVAVLDDKIVGSLMITTEWSDWRCKNYWYIQSVYVKPEHRRKKIFTTMYNHVRSLAKEDKSECAALRLYVDVDNKKAQSTYESLGMKCHYSLMEEHF
ncbi:diamine acetyltransferase [Acrasis kona]|uniref:Diamine acetyltransferase n=1 Tax=Acrasis kona TaxID=1008807 RepID=A0AAW2YN87_9EUKA